MTLKREEQRKREEKQKIKAEQIKRIRQKFWRTITGKKQRAGLSSDQCRTMNYKEVVEALESLEFHNINIHVTEDLLVGEISREGLVKSVTFNGISSFDAETQFPYSSQIDIIYHMIKRQTPPLTSRGARKMDIDDVVWEFSNAGFINVEKKAIPDLKKGLLVKEDSVESVTIDGNKGFRRSDRVRIDANIIISYHTFRNKQV